jgi:hypothetical protein
MGSDVDLQNQWDAFLKLVQVREPKLYHHLKNARPKEVTKYNLVLLSKNAEDLKEVEVGLKVYKDKVDEFIPWVFESPKGIKSELASGNEWEGAVSVAAPLPASTLKQTPVLPPVSVEAPKVTDVSGPSMGQSELLEILETSIRKKVEGELRESFRKEMDDPALKGRLVQQAREDLEEEEQNRRLVVRLTLIADGDKALSDLVMAWQQAKQNGDGGPPWNDAKQHLLELLDATVQLIQS